MARPRGYRRPVKQRTRDALIKTHGNLLAAAELLGCSRQNVDQTITRYPELQRLCAELLQEEIDLHEGTLRKLAIEKEQAVPLLAFLNAKARDRGYNRTQNDVSISGAIEHRHTMHLSNPRFAHLEDAELAELIAARLGASPEPNDRMIDVTPRRTPLHLPPAEDGEPPDRKG